MSYSFKFHLHLLLAMWDILLVCIHTWTYYEIFTVLFTHRKTKQHLRPCWRIRGRVCNDQRISLSSLLSYRFYSHSGNDFECPENIITMGTSNNKLPKCSRCEEEVLKWKWLAQEKTAGEDFPWRWKMPSSVWNTNGIENLTRELDPPGVMNWTTERLRSLTLPGRYQQIKAKQADKQIVNEARLNLSGGAVFDKNTNKGRRARDILTESYGMNQGRVTKEIIFFRLISSTWSIVPRVFCVVYSKELNPLYTDKKRESLKETGKFVFLPKDRQKK